MYIILYMYDICKRQIHQFELFDREIKRFQLNTTIQKEFQRKKTYIRYREKSFMSFGLCNAFCRMELIHGEICSPELSGARDLDI